MISIYLYEHYYFTFMQFCGGIRKVHRNFAHDFVCYYIVNFNSQNDK